MFGWKKIEIFRGTKINYTETDNKLKDILSTTKDEFLDEDEKPCLLMVIMKQWQRLDKMISIFTHANDNGIDLSKVPTLIIDDEADHYSLDTKSNSKSNSKDKNSSEYYIVEEGDTIETISEKKFVPEEMLDDLCIAGTPDTAIKKLNEFRNIGIDLPIIQFNPIGDVKESFELLTKTFSGELNE